MDSTLSQLRHSLDKTSPVSAARNTDESPPAKGMIDDLAQVNG